MLKKIDFNKMLPYLVAVISFIVISYAYFTPLLEGKKLSQHDQKTFTGGAKEIIDYREETGKEALWTNRMFCGMPAYLISVKHKGNLMQYVNRALQIGPRPGSYLFLLLLGSFILLLSLRVNPWLSIVGAIAFAFSSYNFMIILAGHNTKVVAIAYAAPVLAGIFMTFRGKRILGAALTGIFLSLQILASHPQITYYTLIIVLFFGISELVFSIKEKQIKELLISSGLLIAVVLVSVLSNYSKLATTMEYDDYSMRSESELTEEEGEKTGGLTLSYATGWSYGIDETMTLLIPGFKGGSSTYKLSDESNTYAALEKLDPNFAKQFIQQPMNMYWGNQTSTSGPVYLGAIVIFLFVLGMFILDNKTKWWMFAVTLLAIMLAWGKNFPALTNFFMYHVPGYNKFRTVSMTLVIPQLIVPLMGLLTLNKVLYGDLDKKKILYGLKWAGGISAGLAFLFLLFPGLAGNFSSAYDTRLVDMLARDNQQLRNMLMNELVPAIEKDRMNMLRIDALRSTIFILLSGGLLFLVKIKEMKIKMNVVLLAFAVLFIADMWPVNKRFLNDSNFESAKTHDNPYTPSAADNIILSSKGLNERVLNLTVSPFMDASTSYFHQSLGGYHGAKMRRYQDLVNTRMMDEMGMFIDTYNSRNMTLLDSVLSKLNILNMLNTKYIILNPNGAPMVNQYAKGNAWFVSEYELAENADQELSLTSTRNLDKTAVLDKKYSSFVENKAFSTDSAASISLVEYEPNRLVYNSSSATEQIAVFSEIFYDKGWNAYIDDEGKDHFRVDYTLRGLVIPEGEHTIVFEFKPKTYFMGEKISLAGSVLLILMLLGSVYYEWKSVKKED